MPREQKQNFMQGAIILSAATALVKIIGALFKIPLGNLIGDEGMAYFNVAYNIYQTLFIAATAGLPVAISKMVSEAEARGRQNESKRIFNVALAAFFVVGAVGTAVMLLFPRQLAAMMNNDNAYLPIIAIAPSVFCVAITASYRGYNQGKGNMYPTAISQVIEALGKLFIGFGLAYWLYKTTDSLVYAAAGAIAGITCGTVLSALYMMVKSRRAGAPAQQDAIPPRSNGKLLSGLLKIAIPITISSLVLSLTNMIDTSQINGRLKYAAGFTELEASKLYGSYTFAQTMFNLPPAFIVTIAISVLPAIAAAMARGDKREAGATITASMKMSMLLALPAAAGLMALSGPIMNMLFFNQPGVVAVATPILSKLSWAIPFVCLVSVTNAILQSLGRVYIPIVAMIAGGVVKITLNYILVGNPDINIYGAPVGTIACYSLIAAINAGSIILIARPPKLLRSFIKPAIAAVAMGFAAWGVSAALLPVMGNTISTGIAIICGIALYIVFVVVLRILNYNDVMLLPKGKKIANLLKIRKI